MVGVVDSEKPEHVDVCRKCAAPAEMGRIFCKNCGATVRPPVPLIRFRDQSTSDLPQHERESGGILAECVGTFVEVLFEGGVVEVGELFLYLLVPLVLMFGLYLVAGMVYHLMFDPNAVDVASRLDMLSIDPDKWFPRS
jgi:hypothetical protein